MTQKQRWVPTILFIPFIYFVGWISSQALRIIWPNFQEDELPLLGTLISFIFFLRLLRGWGKMRWNDDNFFFTIGLVDVSKRTLFRCLFRGFICAFTLLSFILIPLLLTTWGTWVGAFTSNIVLNGFILGFGVGFAEEIIFRGWLLTEMNHLLSNRLGLFVQALIFSLVHLRISFGFWRSLGLLFGLFLLGLCLALMRKIDRGSIWGCIGLHSGLVGGWFVISNGLIEFSTDTPAWLFGPGGSNLNPIGGIISIFVFSMIIYFQRIALAIDGRPLSGARKASSRDAFP